MGNSYTCLQLTTSAQRKSYLIDNVLGANTTIDEWSPLIDAPKETKLEDFMAFHEKLSYKDWQSDWRNFELGFRLESFVDPDDKRTIKDLDATQKALKFWAQMRGWSKKTYTEIKNRIKTIHNTQLKAYHDLLQGKRQAIFAQIRKDILIQLEDWVTGGQINENKTTIEHKKFDKTTSETNYSVLSKIEQVNRLPVKVNVNDPNCVLGWDWIYAWHAVNLGELVYKVPNEHTRLGGAKLIMCTDHSSFVMPGSCMSFGGDDWGGISNAERNRRELAKPSTRHHTYKFKLQLIKY